MHPQPAGDFYACSHTGRNSGSRALSALMELGLLCWPMICAAQMVGPTPQPQGIPVTPEQAEQVQPENWAIHGDGTITWELQPAFRSPYSGPQSLSPPANGRETIDTTLYAGIRPWLGAEIWINPEVDQGFGLSDSFGVAGYPSGEAYFGKMDPYFLVQRGFLRQTIDLGGETEKVDPDLNQLGGTQTANRLVLTIGKYSIVDIFDTNTYAHDPRNDFLNWSIIDQGAFDYTANAWGYTYGGAAEWYQNWWTVRTGVFDLSLTPNSVALSNYGFAQGQFVAELEERHHLWDQPGKLKLLYWLTHGNLGTYLDAITLGAATGQIPSTGTVRSFRNKDGVGLNLEQQIATDLGVFARASMSQGTVEEVDFTDINQSLSAGLSLKGSRWARPDDTVGLAGVANRISHQGKLYLAAGGLGGIIGDGQLPNAGPEQILEAYYRAAVFSFAYVAADYQFINNPAYNRDRGPVSIFALQLHVQY